VAYSGKFVLVCTTPGATLSGIWGLFKTEEEGHTYAKERGMLQDEYYIFYGEGGHVTTVNHVD
jgi:hypothetical protein